MQQLIEPRHEKNCLQGLRPGKSQTGLLSYSEILCKDGMTYDNISSAEFLIFKMLSYLVINYQFLFKVWI